MTRYLLMPLRAAPLMLMATFSLLWWCSSQAGFFGVPLGLILMSWFFKYCYVLLDAVVAGHDDLPVLSVEMLNPVDEQRPLFQAVMVLLEGLLCWWLYRNVAPIAGLALGALLVSALPATVGLLAISDSWVHAVSPLAIGRIMKGLGRTYIIVVAVTLACALLIVALEATVNSQLLVLALTQLVFMAMFCFIGGAIFERRVELQLETRTRGERMAERQERYHLAERAAVLDRTFSLLRLKRRDEAWGHLQVWMRKHCPDSHPFTEYHALFEATCGWDDPTIGDQVANEYLGKLLAAGETGMALDTLQGRLNGHPAFYPRDKAAAHRLTELARLAGRRSMSRQLLANAAATES